MSARRQSSTASLAKYARTTSSDTSPRNLDFCNAFWGVGDGGVDVLFARMRGAARTMEELRNFWKERSAIEEDYAKRLAKLAKVPIGKDEIGELRNSIDTLRLETDKQAGSHSQLAQQIRTDLEGQVGAFVSKQQHHKKVYQTAIEKEFKVKQTREQHASKAREKYESDCLRINSYTAQSTLVQGKDLEKIHLKLERAQQTVQVNENDYAQFTRVLQETMQKWEQDWKAFCDTCQDLEEERMEFMKDNIWAYANAVSTVCVSDDESCEKLRLALEQLEPEKDMENFVRDYGTGNAIPEPPVFVDYANTDAPPVSSTRVTLRPASFNRTTQRASRVAAHLQDDEPYDDTNHAGVGAGGIGVPPRSTPVDAALLSRSTTQKSTTNPRSTANGINGHVSPPQRRRSIAPASAKPVSAGDPVDPMVSNTQLVIGDRTWDVDPNKDPQQQKATQARASPPVAEQDPLVKQMAELNTAAAASGTVRRNTIRRDSPPSSLESRKGTGDSLSTPSTKSAAPRDFRNSAEVVVGSYPFAQPPSRSASPNPPQPVFAAPPPPSVPPSISNIPVEQVVSGYQRPFPGEPRSRANSYVGPPPPVVNPNQDQGAPRPTSRGGYPGVGVHSLVPRPLSPARGPSPTAVQPYNRGPPAPSALPNNAALQRGMSVSRRPVTPTNPVGIALGPDGRVVHDMMVQPIRQASVHYPQPAPPPQITLPPQPYPGYHDTSRALTHPQQQPPPQQPPPPRNDYAVVPQGPYGGAQVQPYNYGHPPQHAGYNDGYHAQPYSQPAQANYGSVTRPAYHGHQQSQSVGHLATNGNAAQQRYASNNAVNTVYRSTSPGIGRSPSPAALRGQPPPTGTYTDDGRPILFYVKALYDYSATIDEEFDFQSGDIIAVTETPEDGWWSGELLDDTRRQAGRHVFPSNFVCLF
ncbi:hypothetical protein JVT61DRAFT_783 [Boletus reticuloceps]|uniref:Septation protein imp2 n=1 Tax=Boletus reticuloceps TaxID=495285 RepID=A0A8I2Z1P3_9AGAM|nr:hypothetical protein JVT61DRAFT_783 [Boletus reticuloceps]